MSRGYFIWPSLSLRAWLGWRLRAGLTLSLLDGWDLSQLTRRLTGWQLRRRLAAELGRAARHSTALDVLPMRFHDNWPPSSAVFNVSWKSLFDGQDDLSADAGFVAATFPKNNQWLPTSTFRPCRQSFERRQWCALLLRRSLMLWHARRCFWYR